MKLFRKMPYNHYKKYVEGSRMMMKFDAGANDIKLIVEEKENELAIKKFREMTNLKGKLIDTDK